jgi:hypothetical protein
VLRHFVHERAKAKSALAIILFPVEHPAGELTKSFRRGIFMTNFGKIRAGAIFSVERRLCGARTSD